MVWFYFKYDEWTDHPAVKYQNLDLMASDTIRHSVTAVDWCLINGKKSIIVEDSWGPNFGFSGQRVIDEDFFNARNWYSGYLMNFRFEAQPVSQKPQYTFNIDLEFGMTSDEVKALQDCLRWERLFPSNAQSTGYFGAVTKKAVQDFQIKYGVTTAGSAGYGRVGPKTRAKLNEIFS